MCILFLLLCYYFILIGINPFFTELFCQCFRAYSLFHKTYPCQFSVHSYSLFMPPPFEAPPFEEWWRGIKCYPCPCVRSCVRSSVRPSVIKIWCPLNNFWKTASIQFQFGTLIYNIKTQVKFDLVTIHWFLTELWAFYKNKTKIGVRSITWKTASIRFIFGIVQKLVSAQ